LTIIDNIIAQYGDYRAVMLAPHDEEIDISSIVMDRNVVYQAAGTQPYQINGTPKTAAQMAAYWLSLAGRARLNDATSLVGNPMLMAPAAGRFEVPARSIAVGASLGGGTIGAWQYPGYDPHWIGGPPRDR